jgi:hypothetical protein
MAAGAGCGLSAARLHHFLAEGAFANCQIDAANLCCYLAGPKPLPALDLPPLSADTAAVTALATPLLPQPSVGAPSYSSRASAVSRQRHAPHWPFSRGRCGCGADGHACGSNVAATAWARRGPRLRNGCSQATEGWPAPAAASGVRGVTHANSCIHCNCGAYATAGLGGGAHCAGATTARPAGGRDVVPIAAAALLTTSHTQGGTPGVTC